MDHFYILTSHEQQVENIAHRSVNSRACSVKDLWNYVDHVENHSLK